MLGPVVLVRGRLQGWARSWSSWEDGDLVPLPGGGALCLRESPGLGWHDLGLTASNSLPLLTRRVSYLVEPKSVTTGLRSLLALLCQALPSDGV